MTARVLPFASGRTEARRLPAAMPPVTAQAAATLRVQKRGYVILYRHGQVNHCPGCGKTHWWIGNRSAECAFCATAVDLQRF